MQVPSEPGEELQPAALAAVAGQLFADGPLKLRLLQRYRPYLCPFHKLLPLVPPSATVLDAGCGGGLFLGLLASTRGLARGLGFDSSRDAIEVARRMSLRLRATSTAHSTQRAAAAHVRASTRRGSLARGYVRRGEPDRRDASRRED